MSEEHTVTSSDGATATLFAYPAASDRAPCVLCFPAMGVTAGFYVPSRNRSRAGATPR